MDGGGGEPWHSRAKVAVREAWYWVTGYTVADQIRDQRRAITLAVNQANVDRMRERSTQARAHAECRSAVRLGRPVVAHQYARSAVAAERRMAILAQAVGELQHIDGELSRITSNMHADVAMTNIATLLQRFAFKYGGQADMQSTLARYRENTTRQLEIREMRQEALEDAEDEAADTLDADDDEARAGQMVQLFQQQLELQQAEQISAAMASAPGALPPLPASSPPVINQSSSSGASGGPRDG